MVLKWIEFNNTWCNYLGENVQPKKAGHKGLHVSLYNQDVELMVLKSF